jgi:hypothetical protein
MSAQSVATRLVELVVDESDARLFHTPKGDSYITVRVDGHLEHHAVGSTPMKKWLSRLAYTTLKTSPPAQAVNDAMTALSGMALYDGPEHDVAVRIGQQGHTIFVDLGDPHWRTIAVTARGWSVEADAPIRFRRSRGTLALPEPVRGGSVDDLRQLIHVDDDADFHLLMGFLLGAFSPRGPYPLLNLTGEQGAGKSTVARILRRLVDPHTAELRAAPKREEDVMIAASGGHLLGFDNFSHIEPWQSDILCVVSTGGAITKRQLFTDGDEHSIEAIRPVMITSVVPVVQRGDLLDRTITVDLPVMSESSRRLESAIWAEFTRMAPAVLGALLDGVAAGLARASDAAPARLPRLADWATWTYRCAPGIGWPAGSILDAYRVSRQQAVSEAVAGDPVAVAVRAVARPWTGTAAALLKLITPTARPPRGWPETPRGMSAALRRLAPMLRQVGIEVTLGVRRHGGERLVRIDDAGQPSPSSPPSPRPKSPAESGDCHGDESDDGRVIVTQPSPESTPDSLSLDDGDDGDGSPVASSDQEVPDASRY